MRNQKVFPFTSAPSMILLAIALLVLGPDGSAHACNVDENVPGIPFVYRSGVGARAMGMAGAVSASAADYNAIYYNPAALALIGRAQVTASTERRAVKRDDFFGVNADTSHAERRLHSIGIAYPYSGHWGSVVIGVGYDVVSSFDFAHKVPAGRACSTTRLHEDGALGAWSAGLSVDVIPRVSLGAAGALLRGESRTKRTTTPGIFTNTVTDISGMTGRAGALVRVGHGLSLGLAYHLPEKLDRSWYTYKSYTDSLSHRGRIKTSDKLTLPSRMTGALSYSSTIGRDTVTFGTEATITDWTKTDASSHVRTRLYRNTTELRTGAEYTLASIPLSLRAGFASLPLPYHSVNVDLFTVDCGVSSIDTDRRVWTMGLGLRVFDRIRLDLAYERSSYTRSCLSSAGPFARELVRESRLLVGSLLEW